ncbi:hypothetical protein EXIGLDRAFT_196392 [Exidia glandulosa HHB12029]|uniref:Uncharacterized protein n=1 Tax=Exidia glandulosa HHB12029 TaxID=1314781 RepID=A0A165EU58_EXIGL|nr:hypothetical protein EXIGLDRAFT_196392 [Exidia glandulosa HHB12029]
MSSASLTPAESASGLETLDPTRGFHPLISVYFMVREKLERERAAREGDDPRFDQVQHAPREKEHHSRAPTMEAVQETSTRATPQPPKEKDKLRVPGGVIAPPQPMRLAGAEHVPSPPSAASATTPRERARLADGVVPPVSPLSPIHPTPDKEKGEPVLKMPPVSAHRRSASVQKTVAPAPVPAALPQQQAAPTKVAILPTPPASAPPSKISVAGPGIERHHTVQISHSHSTTTSGTSGFVRRFGSITSRRRTSSLVGSPPSMPPPPREPREARNSLAEGEVLSDSEGGPGVGRWGTIGRRWKGAKVGTAGAGRVVSEGTAALDRRPMSAGVEGVVEEREEDEADQQVLEVPPPASSDVGHQPPRRGREKEREDEEFKAVPLKGSFSVATTSTKGAKALRADVRRTLTRMGIPFREIPGGFECAHEPSVVSDKARAPRQVKKKGSKISIGGPKRRPTEPAPTAPPEKALPDRPADGHESVSSSLVHLAAAARDAVEQEAAAKSKLLKDRTPSPVAVKMAQPPATPIRRDFAANADAEKDYEHFMKRSALGVRFEIHIVKVSFFSLARLWFDLCS